MLCGTECDGTLYYIDQVLPSGGIFNRDIIDIDILQDRRPYMFRQYNLMSYKNFTGEMKLQWLSLRQ